MSNRKNTGAVKSAAKPVAKPVAKSVAKPVAKPVANTVHSHSDLEQQISELKKELKQAMTVIDRLNSVSIEMSAKIESLTANKPNGKVDLLLTCLKSHGGLKLSRALLAKGL